MSDFRKDLEIVINKHSKEKGSNTPDFILAEYLEKCLELFDLTITNRNTWYGKDVPIVDEKIEELD